MLRRKVFLITGCALAAVLAIVSVADTAGFRRYARLRGEMSGLDARIAELRVQNARLSREVEALRSDPQALERAAREELGFIAPGEVIINLE